MLPMQERERAASLGLKAEARWAGCTAVAAMLYGTTLVLANAGDCRCQTKQYRFFSSLFFIFFHFRFFIFSFFHFFFLFLIFHFFITIFLPPDFSFIVMIMIIIYYYLYSFDWFVSICLFT
jgi:hypothetical protein